ncbi:MAG: cadherin-like beta sandwich domain-containing protein [Chloroflexi bacterium]|nr:cadherin-like beta sandwich domain-containing protein [Chloroflexota bacterium]
MSLTQEFAANVTSYSATIDPEVLEGTINATTGYAGAAVSFPDAYQDSDFKVPIGSSDQQVVVTAEDGVSTTSYTVSISRTVVVAFAASTYTVGEGSTVSVQLSLSHAPVGVDPINVPLLASNTTASNNDYTLPTPARVSFTANSVSDTITFTAVDDSDDEDDETVTLSLGTLPEGVMAGSTTSTVVTIIDNDEPPGVLVSFGASTYSVVEGESVNVTVMLAEAPGTGNTVTVPLTATSTTASTSDYTLPSTLAVTFRNAETTKSISFGASTDGIIDQNESVTIGLGSLPTGYSPGSPSSTTVNITDDDDQEVTVGFERAAYTIPESSMENIKVKLSSELESSVTIRLTFSTEANGATDTDYSIVPDNDPYDITIEAGQTEATLSFKSERDSDDDDGETVTIRIEDPIFEDLLSLGSISQTVVTIKPRPVQSNSGGGGGGGGGAPAVIVPSDVEFEWNVNKDIESLDSDNDEPTGLWSDGETIWVLDNAGSGGDKLFAYDLESGERTSDADLSLHSRNRFAHGIWSDGETAWVADSGQDKLFVYDLDSGERQTDDEFDLHEDNKDPRGIWSDGETIYVLDSVKNAIFAYNLSDGEFVARYALASLNDSPRGIWSDGTTFWVSDDGAKRVFAYEIQDGALERQEEQEFSFRPLLKAGNGNPRGIWSDMDVLYVADEQDDRIYSYNMPDAMDARLESLSISGIDFGVFSSLRTRYMALLPNGPMQTTVAASTMNEQAAITILPADVDATGDNGHQVQVGDQSEVKVMVTAPDGRHQREYSVYLVQCLSGLNGLSDQRLGAASFFGGSGDDLTACARGLGVSAVYHQHEGAWAALFLDGPAFLSAPFRGRFSDGIPTNEGLIVKLRPVPITAPEAATNN